MHVFFYCKHKAKWWLDVAIEKRTRSVLNHLKGTRSVIIRYIMWLKQLLRGLSVTSRTCYTPSVTL